MKFSRLTLAFAALISILTASQVFAIELYVDTKTKQIYAEPGPGRELMGEFQKVNPYSHGTHVNGSADSTSSERAEIEKIKQDLELKETEIKSLEEHVAENKELHKKDEDKWYSKLNFRGYTQLRYNQPLTGDRISDPDNNQVELRSPGDSGIKNNSSFTFRRVRMIFFGDISDYLYLYIQPDFATNVASDIDNQNFAQLRDAYADISFDKKHEWRIRAGQS